jgi:ankyrin repeat protein
LQYATWKKQAAAVRLLLSAGANVDTQDNNGKSALMLAVDTPDIAKLLLDKGARTTLRDSSGWTALMYATKNSDAETVRLLRRKAHEK